MSKLYFIGGGKMASAIAGGLLRSGTMKAEDIGVFDPDPSAAKAFTQNIPITVDTELQTEKIAAFEAVLIAVKPQMITTALAPLAQVIKDKLLISIAAGIPIAKLQELTGCARIVRVMPNTPALVGYGASGYAVSETAGNADSDFAQKILSAIGVAVKLKEHDLDGVTALSGSGPAYVFEFIQALADGGVAEGLTRDTALQLAIQTVIGAAEMVKQTGEHPASLKDKVTSPAGTTSRALEELAERGFAGTVIKAVRAAAARSRELGKN